MMDAVNTKAGLRKKKERAMMSFESTSLALIEKEDGNANVRYDERTRDWPSPSG